MPTAKCPYCKQDVTPADGTRFKSRLYHKSCYDALIQSAKEKDSKRSRASSDPDARALESYLLSLFGIKDLTPLLQKQIADMRTRYSYQDILYAVRYVFQIEEPDTLPCAEQGFPSLGIVPYRMTQALAFRSSMEGASSSCDSFHPSDDVTVQIHKPESHYHSCDYDISSL